MPPRVILSVARCAKQAAQEAERRRLDDTRALGGADANTSATVSLSPVSSTESLVTIPEVSDADRPRTPTNGDDSFGSLLHRIAGLTPGSFKSLSTLFTKRQADAAVEETGETKKRRLLDTSQEVEVAPGSMVRYSYNHPELLRLVDNQIQPPLVCFTNRSLKEITEKSNALPRKKLASKVSVIDVTHFGDDLKLEESEWRQGAENFLGFCSIIGTVAYVERFRQHFDWFLDIPDFSDKFAVVRATEAELRTEYASQQTVFNPAHYHSRFQAKHIELKMEEMDGKEQRREAKFNSLFSRPSAVTSHPPAVGTSRQHAGPSRSGGGGRFQAGNRGDPSAATCLICARKGHQIAACSDGAFPDGKPVFAESRDGSLRPRGRDEALCVMWNVNGDPRGKCAHGGRLRHICSFCGSNEHHALAWRCRANPN
ncbi:hypothetical protein GLOTRDRAFT_130961 [Gloeophyllum trabeum ATCC 11539]|uniref:Uncharacterized protein n=1 Tax=Gloeophyllum trabeum (strain ATCC 11539 / FP-39264 / Madison 617) TaxID=670483 RepID=S7Q236_GLOTA|nr:uncharacterized protein GLOTRDRAFT_130961 [Gloeophyllum trabeum ATCC 11539]EPQ53623.1 hypothetical protein GLOTRDRAFT_130961 [Gloeophyllum trabeum ATCC 11539]